MTADLKGKKNLTRDGMQTERKASPAGKTKDVWGDVVESFFNVRGTKRVQEEGSWSFSRSANDAWSC